MNEGKHCFINCSSCPVYEKSIFRGLDASALEELKDRKIPSQVKRGQTLFIEKNPSFGVYCLGEGNIKTSRLSSDGKETIMNVAGPGEVLGHHAVFGGEPYLETATALQDSHTCFIDKSTVYEIINKNPGLAIDFLKTMSKDLGGLEYKVADLSNHDVRERVAGLLQHLGRNFGSKVQEGIELKIQLSRAEMAALIGTAKETLTRILSELKSQRIISQRGKSIVILNRTKLKELCGCQI